MQRVTTWTHVTEFHAKKLNVTHLNNRASCQQGNRTTSETIWSEMFASHKDVWCQDLPEIMRPEIPAMGKHSHHLKSYDTMACEWHMQRITTRTNVTEFHAKKINVPHFNDRASCQQGNRTTSEIIWSYMSDSHKDVLCQDLSEMVRPEIPAMGKHCHHVKTYDTIACK